MDHPTESVQSTPAPGAAPPEQKQGKRRGWITGALAVGAVILEPELLPGILIGLAAAVAPKLAPRVKEYVQPWAHKMRTVAESALAQGRELRNKVKERTEP